MSTMLNLSEGACIGLHAMVLLAVYKEEKLLKASQMADALNVSKAHLSKVLQRLAKDGYVESTRGPGGGFKLKKAPGDITLLDIYESIEGPLLMDDCLFADAICSGYCMFGSLIEEVNSKVRNYLEDTTLSGLKKTYGEDSIQD